MPNITSRDFAELKGWKLVAVLTVLGRLDHSVSETRGAAVFYGIIPGEAKVW